MSADNGSMGEDLAHAAMFPTPPKGTATMNINALNNVPILMWMEEYKCYALRLSERRADPCDDRSYYMLIDKSWDGESWYAYRFMCDYGGDDVMELVTKAEYDARMTSIRENEGDRIAAMWHQVQDVLMVERDSHPVFTLRQHWEAMAALKLITIPTSLRVVAIRKMSTEAHNALDELRRELQEQDARAETDEPEWDEIERCPEGKTIDQECNCVLHQITRSVVR